MIEPVFRRMLTVEFRVTVSGITQMFPAKSLEKTADPIQITGRGLFQVERHHDGHGTPSETAPPSVIESKLVDILDARLIFSLGPLLD